MNTTKVTGCTDCPFCWTESHRDYDYRVCTFPGSELLDLDSPGGELPAGAPDLCPLRKGSIAVRLVVL